MFSVYDEKSTEEDGDCEHDVSGLGLSVHVETVYQHTDYVFRNAALYFLNLYEFSALFEKKQMIVV